MSLTKAIVVGFLLHSSGGFFSVTPRLPLGYQIKFLTFLPIQQLTTGRPLARLIYGEFISTDKISAWLIRKKYVC